MSKYYYLCCKTCEVSLNLGKKLAAGNTLVMQGVYSEVDRSWISDRRTWLIVQEFFQRHDVHDLVFASDEALPFPRDSDFVGFKTIPHDALNTAIRTGRSTLKYPNAFVRLYLNMWFNVKNTLLVCG